jgi:hypothetical protein
MPGGALIARDAVLRLTGRAGEQSQILEWRQARPALFDASDTGDPVL